MVVVLQEGSLSDPAAERRFDGRRAVVLGRLSSEVHGLYSPVVVRCRLGCLQPHREVVMRMMMRAIVDTEAGSETIRNGSIVQVLEQMVKQLNPEALYFHDEAGQRAMTVVFDMADPSQMPLISEPLFMGAKARVSIIPCMNLDDVQRGLSQLPPELLSPGA